MISLEDRVQWLSRPVLLNNFLSLKGNTTSNPTTTKMQNYMVHILTHFINHEHEKRVKQSQINLGFHDSLVT